MVVNGERAETPAAREGGAGGKGGRPVAWGSGQPVAAAVIPLVDDAAGDGADGAADDRADGAVAATGDLVAGKAAGDRADDRAAGAAVALVAVIRSEEHTSELQSLMRISYAVFCLKKKKKKKIR